MTNFLRLYRETYKGNKFLLQGKQKIEVNKFLGSSDIYKKGKMHTVGEFE